MILNRSHLACRIETWVAFAVGIVVGVLATLSWHNLSPIQPVSWQPYGGCNEAWQAPRSEGADVCRDHGWTVRARFVLTPSGRVAAMRLRPCRWEDSDGPCYWDAQRQGNRHGDSFIILGERDGRHRIFYVRFPRC